LYLQAACELLVIAIVHCDNRLSYAIALALFATGVAASVLLITAHDRPFTGQISISPGSLLQSAPGEPTKRWGVLGMWWLQLSLGLPLHRLESALTKRTYDKGDGARKPSAVLKRLVRPCLRALTLGAHARGLEPDPDVRAQRQTMTERLHSSRITLLCGRGHYFRRFDQIREPNGAAIGTR
jgi:hypothetical protein